VRETEILVEQQSPQGVFVCDDAGLVIKTFSLTNVGFDNQLRGEASQPPHSSGPEKASGGALQHPSASTFGEIGGKCSRDTYPGSYITEYASVYEDKCVNFRAQDLSCFPESWNLNPESCTLDPGP